MGINKTGLTLEETIEKFTPLCRKLAHFYARKSFVEFEDLLQEGFYGLIKAYEKFDEKSASSTGFNYYELSMRGRMMCYINDKQGTVKTPRLILETKHKCFAQKIDSEPAEVIAEKLGIEMKLANEVREYIDSKHSILSLDSEDENTPSLYNSPIFSTTDTYSLDLEEALSLLSENERTSVEMCAQGYLNREIGDKLQRSATHVGLLLKSARKKLSEALEIDTTGYVRKKTIAREFN